MKTPKFLIKAAVATGLKEPPRRRGLGKKTLALMAQNSDKKLALRTTSNLKPQTSNIQQLRGYSDVVGKGGINSDWAISALTEDADVWQNAFLLRSRMRDLFRTDCYFAKYTEELWANVFGSLGYSLRLLIKETEDRVVHAPDEKAHLIGHHRRHQRVRDYLGRKSGNQESRKGNKKEEGDQGLMASWLPDKNRQAASVQVGDLDLFAIKVITDAYKDWQRREYCTVSGVLDYNEVRQIRLLSGARDGDFFLRHIRDPKVNKFGYSLQLINSEWCDFFLNSKAENGNEIRMGIERDKWGKRVAYYFITRQPFDWQFSMPTGYNQGNPKTYTRVPADEIVYYARYKDGDSTRPAPWGASVIVKSRHLDKYEEAEVAAARVGANKMGFLTSTLVPEGGMVAADMPDPRNIPTMDAEPGSFQALPWGIDFKDWDPKHPTQNFPAFRKEMLRAWCAGMPGANYNIIANDLEGVNYSSGRLGMLDERELWKMIQKFDIEVAERPIFEAWLEMALMTGAIPLPLAKLDKFNKPVFRGRRWAWVDPMKEVQARALEVANKFNSRTRIIEDSDIDADFEQILFELAEEEMMMEELGMDSTPAIGKSNPQQKPGDGGDSTTDGSDNTNGEDGKPKAKAEPEIIEARIIEPPKEEMTTKQMIEMIMAMRASEPQRSEPQAITVSPNISVPSPVVSIEKLHLPKQDAPIVNFNPEIKMPEVRSPDVVVNVAAAPAPEVNIHNEVKVPGIKSLKIKRGEDGKMDGVEFEKE